MYSFHKQALNYSRYFETYNWLMKANINDAIIWKGKCHFEKIHSHSNYYFSQSALVTLISKYSLLWESKNYKYNKERFTKSSVKWKKGKQTNFSFPENDIQANSGPFYICVLNNLCILRIRI